MESQLEIQIYWQMISNLESCKSWTVNFHIQRPINEAISTQVLPQIQNKIGYIQKTKAEKRKCQVEKPEYRSAGHIKTHNGKSSLFQTDSLKNNRDSLFNQNCRSCNQRRTQNSALSLFYWIVGIFALNSDWSWNKTPATGDFQPKNIAKARFGPRSIVRWALKNCGSVVEKLNEPLDHRQSVFPPKMVSQ